MKRKQRGGGRAVVVICCILVAVVMIAAVALILVIKEEPAASSDGENQSAETEEVAPVATEAQPISLEEATTNGSYGQLVNRTYPIADAENYAPTDLVVCDHSYGSDRLLRADAAAALNRMMADFIAENPGLDIFVKSGYRDFAVQQSLYEQQINKRDTVEEASTVSAIPGTSEHELGLAADLTVDGPLVESFAETTQGKWFLAHCASYGFIHRYPAGSESITGIIFEPWHFRYVGTDIAQDMQAKGISTLEEYYGLYLDAADLEPYLPYLQ